VLRELTRQDWLNILDLEERDIPECLILRGTRNLRRNYEKYRRLFGDPREIGSPNGLFEDLLIGTIDGRRVGYASVYGPAMASEIAHVFGVLGTRRLIQTGVCGALQPGMTAGDLVIASVAGCGDGAAHCYMPGAESVVATPALMDRARCLAGPQGAHVGPIWTTAALLAEGKEDLERWGRAGYLAVDMETASAYAVAEWAGMDRVSILSVFDNPVAGSHIALEEADKASLRQRGEDRMLKIVLELAARDGESAQ
jgi:purine-nucleoside phosphorylase